MPLSELAPLALPPEPPTSPFETPPTTARMRPSPSDRRDDESNSVPSAADDDRRSR